MTVSPLGPHVDGQRTSDDPRSLRRTLLVPAPLMTGDIAIDGDEAHHGRTVLRVQPGDALRLADGAGRAGTAAVLTVERHRLVLRCIAVEELPRLRSEDLTVAVALPKGDRAADLVRGLTELGVGAIEPVVCARSERQPERLERLQRVAAEAVKQCRRPSLPRIGPLVDIPGLAVRGASIRVLDRSGAAPAPGHPQPLTLVIGPEGGLTPEELERLRAAGAGTVRLAGSILRIETAALAAAAVWTAAWEGQP